ncbi:cobalamin biosynthesis protein [Chloroflexota bacterium]
MLLIMLLALALDLAFGELPNAVHPVAWMGKIALYLKRIYGGHSPISQFVHGAGIALFTIILFTIPVSFLLDYLKDLNPVIYVVVGGGPFQVYLFPEKSAAGCYQSKKTLN